MKISFKNDYSEGCHPNIMEAMVKNNLDQQESYGLDRYSTQAAACIVAKCQAPQSKVYFVSGGTQANLIIISSILRPYESVISASTGHIFNNEAGAIEATGHKVSSVHSQDGKLTPAHIQQVLDDFSKPPHQAKPRLVYISNATELGTSYTKSELQALATMCKQNDLFLFMDGARLASALMSSESDLLLSDIAKLTDVFYIGGTKNGAIIGEAIVINNIKLQTNFEFNIKQKGGMLSKGRLLGIQFLELFREDLFFDLAKISNQYAMRIKEAFKDKGNAFLVETYSNQLFPILTNEQIRVISKKFEFYVWRKIDEHSSAVRLITSWATKEADVDLFIEEIKKW